MGLLPRTEFAYEIIRDHVRDRNVEGSPIEAYLVQYLIISYYSEIEERVKEIIKERLHYDGDHKLKEFVYNTNEKMIGRVKKSDMMDIVKKFGDGCVDRFNEQIDEKDIGLYGTIINHRHIISHSSGASITLREFETAILSAENVLSCLKEAIT